MARRRDGGFLMSCAGLALSLTAAAPGLVALGGAIALAPAASAQVESVEPYWVVVTTADSNIRCGAGSVWYPVGKAAAGQLLRVDGRENEWLRVAYPKGLPVLIKATEASVDASRGIVRTTTPTQLLANNPVGGLFQSWRVLLDVQLPVGTELPLMADVRDTTGEISAYRVGAPDMARAFISERFVRPASPEEIAVWTGAARPVAEGSTDAASNDAAGQSELAQGGDAPRPATPQPAAHEASHDDATADAGQTTTPGEGGVVSSEMASSDGRAADMPVAPAEPAQTQQPADSQHAASGDQQSGGGHGRSAATLEQLKAAFDGLKRVSTEDAEIEPLIAEYERYIASLDDTPGNSARRAYARSQIELLRVRLELQKQLLEVRRTEEFANSSANSVADAVRMMAANPRYIVVGRLGASTVYDGVNLPRMYRVQSVEGGVGRTLAYVLPAENVDVIGYIGQIVGVVGAADADQGLGLPIIVPTRLDALTRMAP